MILKRLFDSLFSSKFIIFLIGGGLGALLNLIIAWILTDIFGIWYLVSYVFGGITNLVFNFLFHQKITFGVKGTLKLRFFKFILVNIGLTLINLSFIYLLTDILYFHYLISGIMVIGTLSVFNFLINRKWVFGKKVYISKIYEVNHNHSYL